MIFCAKWFRASLPVAASLLPVLLYACVRSSCTCTFIFSDSKNQYKLALNRRSLAIQCLFESCGIFGYFSHKFLGISCRNGFLCLYKPSAKFDSKRFISPIKIFSIKYQIKRENDCVNVSEFITLHQCSTCEFWR